MKFSAMLVLALMVSEAADACPVCGTDVGQAVRAALFNQTFFPTLLEVVAAFPAIGLVLYAVHRWLPE
jgi:hypothetical protein